MKRAAILAGVVVLLVSGVGMCSRVAQRGRYAVPYSTYGSGPRGTRGLFMVAQGMGAAPVRWVRDLGQLPEGGMLLAFGGCEAALRRPLRRYEREGLDAWVQRGGVLVVAGAVGYLPASMPVALGRPPGQCVDRWADLLGAIGGEEPAGGAGEPGQSDPSFPEGLLTPFPADPDQDDMSARDEDAPEPPRWALAVTESVAGLFEVPMAAPARLRLDPGADAEVLFEIAGEPAGVRVRHGQGAIVALSAATPFQNGWLDSGLGAVLLFRLRDAYAPGAPLLFDEYHLGVGASRSIVQYLRALGAGPAILQLLVCAGLLLWRLGARLGLPVREPVEAPGGTDSYVEAIGGLYGQTGDRAAVLETLRRRAVERIARRHRATSREATGLLEELGARLSPAAREALEALSPHARSAGSDRAMLDEVREIDALEARAIAEERETP